MNKVERNKNRPHIHRTIYPFRVETLPGCVKAVAACLFRFLGILFLFHYADCSLPLSLCLSFLMPFSRLRVLFACMSVCVRQTIRRTRSLPFWAICARVDGGIQRERTNDRRESKVRWGRGGSDNATSKRRIRHLNSNDIWGHITPFVMQIQSLSVSPFPVFLSYFSSLGTTTS